jgi:NAD(P)H dehydrogenase (quinone)
MDRSAAVISENTMISSYGSRSESDPLIYRGDANKRSWNHDVSTASKVQTLLILFALCYLIIIARTILDEVQGGGGGQTFSLPFGSANLVPSKRLVSTKGSTSKSKKGRNRTTKVLIVYGPDNDEAQILMANSVTEGARSVENTMVIQESIRTATFEQVLEADAVILGSSVENANTHHQVQAWINENWDNSFDLSNKVGGAFVTAGGISAGEEGTLQRLLQSMLIFRMIAVGGNDWTSAFGASAITHEAPFTSHKNGDGQGKQDFPNVCYERPGELVHAMFLTKAYGLGVRVATVAHQITGSCNS